MKKIITEREGNLILATASDDVLGEDRGTLFVRVFYARYYLDWIEKEIR